jgi:zinc D-Ala-D-Ala carboxypeptidase
MKNSIIYENTSSGVRAGISGWLAWFFWPSSGFLYSVLGSDIFTALNPEHIAAFVNGSAAALGITGGIGAYYRHKTSPKVNADIQNVSMDFKQRESTAIKNWFSDAELDCKCADLPDCDYQGIHPTTLRMMNEVREEFGVQFVNSGYRCPSYNKAVGGADSSYHPKGMAGDLRSPTVAPKIIYDWLCKEYPNQYGFGLYKTFVHIDSRTDSFARKAGPKYPWRSYDLPDLNLG